MCDPAFSVTRNGVLPVLDAVHEDRHAGGIRLHDEGAHRRRPGVGLAKPLESNHTGREREDDGGHGDEAGPRTLQTRCRRRRRRRRINHRGRVERRLGVEERPESGDGIVDARDFRQRFGTQQIGDVVNGLTGPGHGRQILPVFPGAVR